MKEGVILLGHGSRREEANEEIRQMAKMVQEADKDGLYEVAFLSFGEPHLAAAAEKLIDKGCEKIIVMPMFLVTGNHIKRDIPSRILLQKTTHPNVKFILAEHFGTHPAIINIVQERIKEASKLI
jgi:sirohydrochlorin ferrochelatase